MSKLLLLHDIISSLDAGYAAVPEQARRLLGLPDDVPVHLARTATDARGGSIKFVSTAAVQLPQGEAERLKARYKRYKITLKEPVELQFAAGSEPLVERPVVVGFGPAGMFAALALATAGYRPIVLERGGPVDARTKAVEEFWRGGALDEANNVQFGEGGAGTFSDGKLTTRIGDARCDWITQQFVRFGAPQDILYKAKPHVGTDRLVDVVKNLRDTLIDLGADIRFYTTFTGLWVRDGHVAGVKTTGGDLAAGAVILAVGHSARDTFEHIDRDGIAMTSKPFSVGVRIEHLQRDIDAALYGRHVGHPNLWPGEYQLSHRADGQACYTFCMCPGGEVVAAASAGGQVVTNGMSRYDRAGSNANSALVVAVDPAGGGADWRSHVRFQEQLEGQAMHMGQGRAPAQSVGRFLQGRGGIISGRVVPTYPHGVAECDFGALFPAHICEAMRGALPVFAGRVRGFDAEDAMLTGVETRTSSPVRLPRGDTLASLSMPGLYPCGEGAGYAGGIMSAAVDGLRVAEAVIARYKRPVS